MLNIFYTKTRQCLFPENFVGDIKTPLFIVNSGFDAYQLGAMVVPGKPVERWGECKHGTKVCSVEQEKTISDFHTTFLETLQTLDSPALGLFIDSCFFHDQITFDNKWNGSPKVNNRTIIEVVGDWFFDRCGCSRYIDIGHDLPCQCT